MKKLVGMYYVYKGESLNTTLKRKLGSYSVSRGKPELFRDFPNQHREDKKEQQLLWPSTIILESLCKIKTQLYFGHQGAQLAQMPASP